MMNCAIADVQLLPRDLCGYLTGSIAVLSPLLLLNLIAEVHRKFKNSSSQTHLPLRPGFLPIFYWIACLLHLALVVVPTAYTALRSGSTTVISVPYLVGLLVLNSFFWLICLLRMVANRHYYELPLTLVISYASATLYSLYPLLIWRGIFPHGFANDYTLLFVIEAVLACSLFLLVASGATLKKNYYTPWDNFFSKFAKIFPYVWPKKSVRLQFYIFLCVLSLVAGRAINVVVPLYSKWIIDALSGPTPRFCYDYILVATFLKFLQGSGAGGGFLNTLRSFLWIRVQQFTTLEIEVDMFRHLHQLSLRWHLSRKTGEVVRIMDRGTNSINMLLNYVLFNVFPTLADIVLAAGFFFVSFNVYFGLLVIITMAIYLGVTISLTEWRAKYRKAMNESENKASSIGVDSLINYETIKHHNAEDVEIERYRIAFGAYQKAEYQTNASLALLNSSQNVIVGVGLTLGSLLAAYLITTKQPGLTSGDYVLFTTYILQLYGPLNFFGSIYRTIQRSFIDMENMLDLLKEDVEITDAPDACELDKYAGTIEFRDVSFGYNPDRCVLNNISFVVNPGETLALVGPSGSGKTTTVRLLFRLYDTSEGQILLNGKDIRGIRLKSLRDRIGIVPQDTVLFNESIRYNIRYARPSASDEEVEEAAKGAAIHDFISSHPDGYECLVGERGLKLSGGEKQRVAIARTILKQPEFILLDEATSALDSKTERSIQKYLFELCTARTCIVVAHRLSTIVHADKILVLSGGRIVERGTHEELCRENGVYAEMWKLQNEGEGGGIADHTHQT